MDGQVCSAQRNPMFVFVFVGALFRLTANTPAFEPLFHFAPRSSASEAAHALGGLPLATVVDLEGSRKAPSRFEKAEND